MKTLWCELCSYETDEEDPEQDMALHMEAMHPYGDAADEEQCWCGVDHEMEAQAEEGGPYAAQYMEEIPEDEERDPNACPMCGEVTYHKMSCVPYWRERM